jgi:hypothetical protein
MYRSVCWITLLVALGACRNDRSEVDRARMPDVATRAGSAQLEDSEPGVEFEAPRLIPAVRAQIRQIAVENRIDEGNLAAFQNGVGILVNAMEADLNRVGVSDTGYFWFLSDSIMREIGSGTGDVPDLPPEKARRATAHVERLIRLYEQRMRSAADSM